MRYCALNPEGQGYKKGRSELGELRRGKLLTDLETVLFAIVGDEMRVTKYRTSLSLPSPFLNGGSLDVPALRPFYLYSYLFLDKIRGFRKT